jgi:hypothetical protein
VDARAARRARPHARPATFAPDGLYFAGADYDASFGLPPTRRDVVLAAPTHETDPDQDLRRSRASRTRSPRRTPAPTRSGSTSGPARRAASTFAGARAIAAALPPFVSTVGPVRRPLADEVRAALDAVPLSALQFHGHEDAALCRAFGRPYLKAIAVAREGDLLESLSPYSDAAGVLLDAPPFGGLPGGTGRTFDWDRVPRGCRFRSCCRAG